MLFFLLCVRLVLVCVRRRCRCRRSAAWKQRAVEAVAKARTGLQQLRHAARSEGEPGVDACQIPLSLSSVSLSFLALQKDFLHALQRERKKNAKQARQIFTFSRCCSAYIPGKIPAAERRCSVRVSALLRSIFPSSGCCQEKKGHHTSPVFSPAPAQQRHSDAVGVSLCVCVCVCVLFFYLILLSPCITGCTAGLLSNF